MRPILRSIMKILKSEGGSSKYRGLGLGAFAAIVAIGSASFYYQNSGNEPSAASPLGAVTVETTAKSAQTIKPAEHNAATCGHDHSADKSVVKVIPQVVVSDDLDLVNSKVGEVMELAFGDELKVSGKVNMNKEVVGGRKAIGMTLDAQGSYLYWLEDLQGGVIGNVVLKQDDGNQVYKFKHQDGVWSFEKIPFKNYVCASGGKDKDAGFRRAIEAPIPPKIAQVAVAATPPVLNSFPSAQSVLYLDFDGETVVGTRWNEGFGDIVAAPSNYTVDGMRDIWHQVSEDMRPFKLNVTTDRSVFDSTPVNKRMQVIFTPTQDFYPTPGVLGVAYLKSFYDGSIDPCWAFETIPSESGIVASHETGHTFGLNHDGINGLEYYSGNGTWGPIMGNPFDQIASWSIGDYQGSTNTSENDLAIIDAKSAPYRDDDYGDTNAAAFILSDDSGSGMVDLTGNIEKTNDVDVFKFTTSGGSTDLDILPNPNLPNPNYVNANLQVTLYDEAGTQVAQSTDPGYGAKITENLAGGVYFLHVEGVGDGDVNVSGFTDYGSLGIYQLAGTITGLGGGSVEIIQPSIANASIIYGNGLVLEADVSGSIESITWAQVSGTNGGVVQFTSTDEKLTHATFTSPGLYTVKITLVSNGITAEATVQVSVEGDGDVQLFPNRGPDVKITSTGEFYSSQGLLIGSVTDDGVPTVSPPSLEWVVVEGDASISSPNASSTIINFANSDPNLVALESSDGEIRTFKLADVVSVFEQREMLKVGQNARWFIPKNDTLGLTWTASGFDDSLWGLADLGIGYNTKLDYVHFLGETGDIEGAMRKKSPSELIRIPFSLPSAAYVDGAKFVVHYNDGFVLYLNGHEIIRRNTPTGTLSWNSTAPESRTLGDVVIADEIDLAEHAAHFVMGENILAIHGLNDSKGDKAFLIDPSLKVGIIASGYLLFTEEYGLDLLPDGDEDLDGMTNLEEHALRTDPTVADAYDPLQPQPNGIMQVKLPIDVPQDVDYIIEQTTNLTTWTEVASKKGKGDWVGTGLNVSVLSIGAEYITYKLQSLEVVPSAFFRLRYELRGPELTP